MADVLRLTTDFPYADEYERLLEIEGRLRNGDLVSVNVPMICGRPGGWQGCRELHEAAFRRYCTERNMKFIGDSGGEDEQKNS